LQSRVQVVDTELVPKAKGGKALTV
jgi:hypothetical protein